jgi:hypothetical protein
VRTDTPVHIRERGGGDGEPTRSETPSLLSNTLRCVSFAEVGRVCRVALREPMHLCTCVSEEGGDGEAACSETPSKVKALESALNFFSFFQKRRMANLLSVLIGLLMAQTSSAFSTVVSAPPSLLSPARACVYYCRHPARMGSRFVHDLTKTGICVDPSDASRQSTSHAQVCA